MRPNRLIPALATLALAGTAFAQGKYVNFEEPQVKPIAIAQLSIGGVPKSFALVCNTPDNSVEIYEGEDVASDGYDLITRVPVGLSPVTVRWSPELGRFFTCNFMGDSITSVQLVERGNSVAPVVERTVRVGDEPTDIAFLTGATQARVALHSRGQTVLVQTSDLATLGTTVLDKVPDTAFPNVRHAVKAPRVLAALGSRFYALNTAGGPTNGEYDLDLFVEDANGVEHLVGGLGTTNTNFAIEPGGRFMYVVGGVARNTEVGVAEVAARPLGFVESHLWVVDLMPNGIPDGSAPVVLPEPSGDCKTPGSSIDLNRNYCSESLAAFDHAQRVSQPSDVLFLHDALTQKDFLVIAAFGSDKLLLLSPDATQIGGYARQIVTLSVNSPSAGYGAVGPRGLAHDPLTGLVWCVNRLDHSLAILSPANPTSVHRQDLAQDPTPTAIRSGRPFLYTATRTSVNHMVACASCHVDARTDGLAWNLGHLTPPSLPLASIPTEIIDQIDNLINPSEPFPSEFQSAKGNMVTQSLQGLVNAHIEDPGLQFVTTNAPYHWRGDKAAFQDFNEAFHNLQGMPDLSNPPVPSFPPNPSTGLTPIEMDQYTAFIETIHYPPNPEQPRTRVYGGSLGNDANSLNEGSGALYGLKLFHIRGSMGNKACVHCHTLPEGSSNTLFLDFKTDGGLLAQAELNPRENAAMRGLFQREKALVFDFDPTRGSNWTRVAEFGLTHDGQPATGGSQDERSLNDFNAPFALGGTGAKPAVVRHRELTEFVRQFDWGVAPAIGWVTTVDATHPADPLLLDDLRFAAEEGNAGLAVYARVNGSVRGYTYDVSVSPGLYRRVGGSNAINESQLLALVNPLDDEPPEFDVLIFQATPAGSERRVAHVSGNPATLSGPSVVPVTLLPMVPDTAFAEVHNFTTFTEPNPGSNDFPSIKAMRALELAALIDGVGGVGGPSGMDVRHEPPRRFRATGSDIRPGAKLMLGMSVGAIGSSTLAWLPLDLVPTAHRTALNEVIWESVEELDPKMTMEFLNGGPALDVVRAVSDGDLSQQGALDPATANLFHAVVVNENNTCVPFTTCLTLPPKQALAISDLR